MVFLDFPEKGAVADLELSRGLDAVPVRAVLRQNDAAITAWTNATAAIDRLPYDEPPVWFYPVRESLGAALLRAGRSADAERVFREDLVRHPRNARSLLGLHEALVRQKKDADAAWIDTQFREAWKNADSQVTIDDL